MLRKILPIFKSKKLAENPIFIPPDNFNTIDTSQQDNQILELSEEISIDEQVHIEKDSTNSDLIPDDMDKNKDYNIEDNSLFKLDNKCNTIAFEKNQTNKYTINNEDKVLHRIIINKIASSLINDKEFLEMLSETIIKKLSIINNQSTKVVMNYLSKEPLVFEKIVIYSISERYSYKIKEEISKYSKK